MARYEWDAFISHASEDKDSVARPLANHLAGFGLKVWLDESELHLGDSLREKIDAGLAQSRFGIVVLSPDFFSKIWTKSELDGLVAKEVEGSKVVLPIWHNLGRDEVMKRSPILAGRLAASTSEGLATVATKIIRAIENSGSVKRQVTPLFQGRLTKKLLFALPEGSFLLSNLVRPNLTPALAEAIPAHHLRGSFWVKMTREAVTKTKFYVFEDAAAYRAHMAARNIYVPEEAEKLRKRRAREEPLPDFDIELVRAYIAAGKSPPTAWRPFITSLSFEDDKYNLDDLRGLEHLTKLERLDLFDAKPKNIDGLGKLKNLRWLYLPDSSSADIGALSSLSNLEHLDLNMTGVTNIQPLSNLKKLRYLHLYCRELSDISSISELENLEFLDLSMTQIQNLSPLKSLRRLRTLVLMGTPVKDLTALSGLDELENLCLWKTKVSDLAALASLTELRTLDIDGTKVRKVAPLNNLRKLRFLNASGTNIRDLASLASNSRLETFLISEEYSGPAKIDIRENWQVWYWTRYLSIDEHHLRALVEVHGNSVAVLQRALRDERRSSS
jgi:hypothetical protein